MLNHSGHYLHVLAQKMQSILKTGQIHHFWGTFRLAWLFYVYYHASDNQKLSGQCIYDIYKANKGGRFEVMRKACVGHQNLLKVRTVYSEMSSISCFPEHDFEITHFYCSYKCNFFLNRRYNKTHLFREEFVNLGAVLNILLRKQYISVLKNHCVANNSTNTHL